jgi:hypothetical protein
VTYGQKFYAKAAGMDVDLPEAITPEQKYLKAIAEGGGSGDSYTKDETDELLEGKADLENGKVPSSQLPSYVDDVVEYSSASLFPSTGESGKIYLALDMNRTYRWSGSEYIPVPDYNIWIGTSAQYSALVADDYDLYFIKEGSV